MIKRVMAGLAITMMTGLLTACDPPMPEELVVELAEREVVCPEASVEVGFAESMLDVASFWNDNLNIACGMNYTVSESITNGIQVSDQGQFACEPLLKVPVSLDGAVITFFVGDNYELNLDAPVLAGILNGDITVWNDPRIAELNEFAVLDSTPIVVSSTALVPARDALEKWVEDQTGSDLDLGYVAPSTELETEALYGLTDGEIRITSLAYTLLTGFPAANLLTIAGDLNSVVIPDARGVQTAGTQLDFVRDIDKGYVEVSYNKENPPLPLLGAIDPIAPYPPVFPISMAICGEDSNNVRNMARYFLRLDAQGVVETGLTSPLPEKVRIASAALVDAGNTGLVIEAPTE